MGRAAAAGTCAAAEAAEAEEEGPGASTAAASLGMRVSDGAQAGVGDADPGTIHTDRVSGSFGQDTPRT